MASAASKYSSDYLPKEQIHQLLLAFPATLQQLLGDHRLTAMYGWDSHIHGSFHWKPMPEHTSTVQYVIEDSIEQRIVIPGESDFLFEVPEKRLEVMFCHESDIHVDGEDEALIHQFMATPPFSDLTWHTQEEVAKSIAEYRANLGK